MNSMNYAGLDIHKKRASGCCVRQADGTIIQENTIAAARHALEGGCANRRRDGWPAGKSPCLPAGFTSEISTTLAHHDCGNPKLATSLLQQL